MAGTGTAEGTGRTSVNMTGTCETVGRYSGRYR